MSVMPEDFDKEVLQFYRECYQAELEKKEKLLERVNLAAGFLTILGGILAYYTTSIEACHFRYIHLAFYIPFAAGCITTFVSMVLVAISIAKGFGYAYVPKTTSIAKFLETADSFNAAAPDSQKIDIRRTFIESLSKQYCKYATINRTHNITRSGYVFKSLRWAVASMFIVVAAVPGFLTLKRDFETKPTQIKVLNPIEVKSMSESQNKPSNQPTPPPQTSQLAPATQPVAQAQPEQVKTQVVQMVKPVWPQGQIIIEANEAKVDTNVIKAPTPPSESGPAKKN